VRPVAALPLSVITRLIVTPSLSNQPAARITENRWWWWPSYRPVIQRRPSGCHMLGIMVDGKDALTKARTVRPTNISKTPTGATTTSPTPTPRRGAATTSSTWTRPATAPSPLGQSHTIRYAYWDDAVWVDGSTLTASGTGPRIMP
jgi:hypothetical protein